MLSKWVNSAKIPIYYVKVISDPTCGPIYPLFSILTATSLQLIFYKIGNSFLFVRKNFQKFETFEAAETFLLKFMFFH